MYKLRVYNTIAARGLAALPDDRYARDDEAEDPAVIVLRSQNLHDLDIPDTVRAIGRAGAGVNNIPVDELTRRGVFVFNTPGANANAVKELVLAAMLVSSRNLCDAWSYTRDLAETGDALASAVEAGKKRFVGRELPGRRIGIIGLGAIGRSVAQACLDLGMDVLGFDPELTVEAAWAMPSEIDRARNVAEVFRRCDFVSLHVPLIDATRDMINAEVLAASNPELTLLNFARGPIVNTDAVFDALDNGILKQFVSDFPDERLRGRPDVLEFPHLGASTFEAEENCAVMVARQIDAFMVDGHVQNCVNFPDVHLERGSPHRLFVANANVPNMVGQISTAMADAGLNIHDMLNQSRGDVACTVVDTDSAIPSSLCEQIAATDGVYRAWVL